MNEREGPPTLVDRLPFDGDAAAKRIEESPYCQNLKPLLAFVRNRTVMDTEPGNAGFILHFDGGAWAATFEEDGRDGYAMGVGPVPQSVRGSVWREGFGDARMPSAADAP